MVILGIDPGLATTGFGAIRIDKSVPAALRYGHIKTSSKEHVANRLFQIHTDIEELIRSVQPSIIAVENVFSLVRYPKAGILLGGVLGIIYLSVFQNNLSMTEITPKEVKSSLAGYGGADKYQIRSAVKNLLKIRDLKSLHASDALAIALTAFYRQTVRSKR